MPGTVIGKELNFGFPGTIARNGDEVSRTRPVAEGTDDIYFGDPVIQNDDGTIQKFGVGNTAADFCGIAIRKTKQATEYFDNQNWGSYKPQEPCAVLQRGMITVLCEDGTPEVGGTVYVVAADGAFSANAAGNVALTNAKFSTGKDARNVCEVTIIERQGV